MHTYPFLQCDAVNKSFGKHPMVRALADITFSVNEGELVCITGSSGSGKTTLLTIIGGLQRPTSGEIVMRGKSLKAVSHREAARFRARHVGFIFQSPALIPVLSAAENIEFALQLAQPELDRGERLRRVHGALEITNLESCRYLRPGQLSGGQCQRVAIARAIVKLPALILADEPTSNLDDDNAAAIKSVFHQLQAQYRSTIVIATHDTRILSSDARIIRLQGQERKFATGISTVVLSGIGR
jgi:putative ABC transport system ATP-binding protein